ncbi:5-amino-6-(D-ribitylamino)uracil--L-tyrosine 4-hydroxyphenyl transferase CofH [Allorhizobium pseudoryzae]|uniref:5-amino-6-(D-ribitylamino)uracil--L-tyrosine 4-hydroxyphenyl transferase CofH n=1 Tax=Allorhizobium pseudoryzae TaxID=379684 RepID=UPI003D079E45
MTETAALLDTAARGERLSDEAILLLSALEFADLRNVAAALRDRGHGDLISYSRKVFIPLTQLCRDSCHYCTFAHPPKKGERAYLTPDQVVAIAAEGRKFGCKEALFTLGDKPELRYRAAREELTELGFESTVDYLEHVAQRVIRETGLLPHINAGVMDEETLRRLRRVSVSQGIMLETASERLSARGGPHFGSPDKLPSVRLETIRAAGASAIPFTSGLLIGIGETRRERIDALLKLRALNDEFSHIQEIIIQNFRAKPGTKMASAPEPELEEQLWTVAMSRLIFGPAMNIQSPPNLRPDGLVDIVSAGVNDWGGISPVTPDHVNPEAPWPQIVDLARHTADAGKILVERLAIYPQPLEDSGRWLDPGLVAPTLLHADSALLARSDGWIAGYSLAIPERTPAPRRRTSAPLANIITSARAGRELTEREIVRLFEARGDDFELVCSAADELRREVCGDTVSYVVTRNINYTNICYFKCRFCAFSKGKLSENLRGRPYNLDHAEIQRRCHEAWSRGGTEVCLQGGIHPDYTGQTYLDICAAIRAVTPGMHIHAFSPLEIHQGAATLGIPVPEFLAALKDAGLSSLPGTAAEILDDEVRAIICPDKINTSQWLEVIDAAHRAGLKTTATIMFGHVDRPIHWARHLIHIREQQKKTGGFTEFVPLPFVPMETPMFLKGASRQGPTFREAMLMHAVARLTLHPHITNIQGSWVKMGQEGLRALLKAGVNDLGGTLMEETITRSAGAQHGQELSPSEMVEIIRSQGRRPRQRNTLYEDAEETRVQRAFQAAPLTPSVNTPVARFERA